MRTLKELNKVILEKYKTFEHIYFSICICVFVERELDLTEEEKELWYNNFLKYKPVEITWTQGPWWDWQENTEEGIDKRIEVLTKIVEDDEKI